ncbi:MAG: hypothetical protein ACJ8C4_20525 [Gemmataceae bacterium]
MFSRLIGVCLLALFAIAIYAAAPSSPEPAFHKELKLAAAEYFSWGRVDDNMRWAPHLCRPPMPGLAYVSESKDESTHGKKLYSLFAKDRNDYVRHPAGAKAIVGQAIVKQSWIPEEVTGAAAETLRKQLHDQNVAFDPATIVTPRPGHKSDEGARSGDHFFPYSLRGEKVFKATKPADLFIMLKLEPSRSDTDDGWVYGTVTPDAKSVTSAGRIASCMKCHDEAKHDHLFGLPSAK